MITAADGTVFTGTVTVVVTIDNGTQSSSGGTAPAHEGNGYHSYTPTQAETNGAHIAFTFTGTGAITSTVQVFTMFPQTVDNNVLAAGATGFAAIDTVVDAILADTSELQTDWANGGRLDLLLDAIPTTAMRGTDSAATASALATVDATVDAILVDTGTTIPALLPSALVGGKMDANIGAVNASTTAAVNLALSAGVIVAASAITGTLSITAMTTDLTETTDDHYIGRIVIWTSGVLINQATAITDYTGASKLVTYTATTEAPSNGDTFIIV
jgi:hypothetical protein